MSQEEEEKYIYGPVSVSYHEDEKSHKSILIFGDRHIKIKNKDCEKNIRIDNFIKNLPKLLQDNVDLFIEGIESQFGQENKNFLMNVINIEPTDKLTKHFLDVRKKYNSYISFYTFLSICSGLANIDSLTEKQATYNFNLLAELTNNFSYENDLNELLDFLTDYKQTISDLILTDLRKLKDPVVENNILKLLKEGINKYNSGKRTDIKNLIHTLLENMDKGVEYFINTFLEQNKQSINTFYNNVAEYGQVFMDAYTLSCVLNKQYKNCVIYAGEAHSRVLRKFLNDHNLFKQGFFNTSDTQCVKFG